MPEHLVESLAASPSASPVLVLTPRDEDVKTMSPETTQFHATADEDRKFDTPEWLRNAFEAVLPTNLVASTPVPVPTPAKAVTTAEIELEKDATFDHAEASPPLPTPEKALATAEIDSEKDATFDHAEASPPLPTPEKALATTKVEWDEDAALDLAESLQQDEQDEMHNEEEMLTTNANPTPWNTPTRSLHTPLLASPGNDQACDLLEPQKGKKFLLPSIAVRMLSIAFLIIVLLAAAIRIYPAVQLDPIRERSADVVHLPRRWKFGKRGFLVCYFVILQGIGRALIPTATKMGTAVMVGGPVGAAGMAGKIALGSTVPVVIRLAKALMVRRAVTLPVAIATAPLTTMAGPAAGSLIGLVASALF